MYNEGAGSYVYQNGAIHVLHPKIEIMVSSESDLSALTEQLAPGSIAYTAGNVNRWQLGLDGTWTSCNGEAPAEEPTEEELS